MMQRTYLAFQHNGHLSRLQATVIAVKTIASLEENNRILFKEAKDDDHVIITDSTVFHPQGGGQPSDIGVMEVSHQLLEEKLFLFGISYGKQILRYCSIFSVWFITAMLTSIPQFSE